MFPSGKTVGTEAVAGQQGKEWLITGTGFLMTKTSNWLWMHLINILAAIKVYISSIFKRFIASTASRQAVQCSGLLMMQERGTRACTVMTEASAVPWIKLRASRWELLQLPDLCAHTHSEGVGCRVCEFHLSKPNNKCRPPLKCAEWKEIGQRAAEETATGMERKKMDHTESRSFWDQENWLCAKRHRSAYGAGVSWEREKQKQGICNYQAVKLLRTSRVLGVQPTCRRNVQVRIYRVVCQGTLLPVLLTAKPKRAQAFRPRVRGCKI